MERVQIKGAGSKFGPLASDVSYLSNLSSAKGQLRTQWWSDYFSCHSTTISTSKQVKNNIYIKNWKTNYHRPLTVALARSVALGECFGCLALGLGLCIHISNDQ